MAKALPCPSSQDWQIARSRLKRSHTNVVPLRIMAQLISRWVGVQQMAVIRL